MASERDLQVARLCVDRGYATDEQVRECLGETASDGQTLRPLEAVLRRRGYISEEIYREISSSHRRPAIDPLLRTCPACATPYSGDLCPRCMAEFVRAKSDEGITVLERDLAAKHAPTARSSAPLDPEVEAAQADPKNRFGKYVLVRELGAGGMGVVFKAWQTDLRRFVALKFIRGVEASEDLERFAREAQLAATLSHPGIAPIYESGEHEGKHFFAMQYVEGQTLDRLLSSKDRPPARKLVEILALAAEAVEYAHERGVIHRDLKPQNIMVDPRGRAYVMDFGLAKSVRTGSSLTGSGFAVGTPSYMAPEQAQGDQPRIGPASDVYALGAILYQIGAGRPPFEGENALQVLVDVVNADPVAPRRLNPKFHPELETVALKALEKDPARRFPSAAELAADLRRWLEGEPVLARASGRISRLVRRIRKHKAVSLGTAALVLGLAVAGGTLALRHREKSARATALPYYGEAANAFQAADKIRFMPAAVIADYHRLLAMAREGAAEAARLDPSFADAHFLMGQVLHRRNLHDEEAVRCFTRAIDLEPGHVRARLERAMWRLSAFQSRYGLETVSRRTGTSVLQFTFGPRDTRFETRRREILADLESAGRLSDREWEKAFLEAAAEIASWRPGEEARLDRAEARLARAAELSPNEPDIQLLWGFARLARGDAPGAAERMAHAIRLAPNDHVILHHAAGILVFGGRREEALQAATRSMEIAGPNPGTLNIRGNIRTDRKEYEEALQDFLEAIRLDPAASVPYSNAAYVHHLQGRHAQAAAAYTAALERRPGEPDYLEARGMMLLLLDRLEEAEADLDRVVAARPDGGAYSNRGAVRSRRGKYGPAMEDYERALKLAPGDAGVPYNIGLLLARQGKHGEALPHYRRALEMGRTAAETWTALGQALLKTRRFAEAEGAFTEVLKQKEGDASALADRAQARAELGKPDEALEDLLAGLVRRPDDAGILRDVGVLHAKARRSEESVPYLERAIAAGKIDVLPLLGEMLAQLGRSGEAEKAFTRAVRELKDKMAWFGRARLYHALGRRSEALSDLDQAIQSAPDFAPAIGYRGVLRLEEKRYKDAAADLRRAIALQPDLQAAFQPFLDDALEEGKQE